MKTLWLAPPALARGCYQVREPEAGRCPRCESDLVFREITGLWYCPRRKHNPLWQIRRNGQRVRFGPEAYAWLAEKLGVDPTDDRLPTLAIKLARTGALLVIVNRNKAIVALAKPKPKVAA